MVERSESACEAGVAGRSATTRRPSLLRQGSVSEAEGRKALLIWGGRGVVLGLMVRRGDTDFSISKSISMTENGLRCTNSP